MRGHRARARGAIRTRAPGDRASLRPTRWPAANAQGGGAHLRRHPRADPSDRERHAQDARVAAGGAAPDGHPLTRLAPRSPAGPYSARKPTARRRSCVNRIASAWKAAGSTPRSVDPSRGYFPRAVFFFGFGLLVLPVLAGAGSFFGRFGDTCSLLAWLAVLGWLRVRIRSEAPSGPAGRSGRRYRSASPACQSTERSCPRPETAIVNGCCRRARPAKVARRCVPVSLSRATVASRLSQQTTRQETGSASADHSTPN